ncbi:hypothetical protein FA95DRAFT_1562042 [Auriscalpium vulgare]|uniref:Uncharacterized protein n=1 Tax=Auriscalpium vulgare TaxID=40419 RepID=A0ACB8RK72_9AGAM|nr:hypothetical protein FA95DRAFT_1562042 [Auriscalpium vulgare]
MDPAYIDKKVVDLTDAELIALGFQGEHVAPGIKHIIDSVRASPENLGTVTCFMIDLLMRSYPDPNKAPPQDPTQPPASPTTPSSPALSEAETLHSARSSSTTPTPGQSSPAQSSPAHSSPAHSSPQT